MLFDGFTMGAQVLNFIVLVWLMKHFLYQPVLNAIAQREQIIAKELSDAKGTKAEAQKEHDKFLQKNSEYDKQTADLLAKATASAKAEKDRLMAEAMKASADWSAKRQADLLTEAKNLHQAVAQRAQQEIFSIARKTLTDLAGLSLEERIIQVFLRKLQELSAKEKAFLVSDPKISKDPWIVRSAFTLPEPQRAQLEKTLREMFGNEIDLRFEVLPGLMSGIVLMKNDSKIAWSIEDYLESMQDAVEELLKKNKLQASREVSDEPKI